MSKFVPRKISADDASQGYNNEGRGELLGYVAVPAEHEETCRYRISTGGNPDKNPHESCSCRIGLWRDATPSQRVVDDIRATARHVKKPSQKGAKNALDCSLDELERITKEWRAAELVSKDFQMMLGRIVYRYGKGLSIEKQITQARDLISRKGTLSPLRGEL
jgi:hypothetical protein